MSKGYEIIDSPKFSIVRNFRLSEIFDGPKILIDRKFWLYEIFDCPKFLIVRKFRCQKNFGKNHAFILIKYIRFW